MKSPLSTQNFNLADAWKLQVGNKGEHMGSSLQGCKASGAVGSIESRINAVHSGEAPSCPTLNLGSCFSEVVMLPEAYLPTPALMGRTEAKPKINGKTSVKLN